MGFVKWYTRMLIERPFSTKSISTFIALGSGDILCQFLEIHYFPKLNGNNLQGEELKNKEEENINLTKNYNFKRTLKQATFGFFMTPYLHLNYNIIIPYLFPGSGLKNLVKSVIYNQIVHSMFCTLVFFTYIDVLNGENVKKGFFNAVYKLPYTVTANLKCWVPAQMINLSIMPLEYRVLFTNFVSILWSCYLSYSQNVMGDNYINKGEKYVKSVKSPKNKNEIGEDLANKALKEEKKEILDKNIYFQKL